MLNKIKSMFLFLFKKAKYQFLYKSDKEAKYQVFYVLNKETSNKITEIKEYYNLKDDAEVIKRGMALFINFYENDKNGGKTYLVDNHNNSLIVTCEKTVS